MSGNLLGKKQAVPPPTSPNKLLNHNNRDTPNWKTNAKHRNATCVQQSWTTNIFPTILLSLRKRPPGTNLTDQPQSPSDVRTRKFSVRRGLHSTFQRSWVTWFRQWVYLVTPGLKIMNSNHLAKHNETQLSRTQLHPDVSEIKKNIRWQRQMASAGANFVASHTDWFHLFILRTSHESLLHESCITQHTN